MKTFLKKLKRFENKHTHELAMLCGGMALLVLVGVFVASGAPRAVHAWIIYIYPFTYTPVTTGGYTTISWTAPTSDYCFISGPTLPCTSEIGEKGSRGRTTCYAQVNGQYGSVYTGPITGPTAYDIYCHNVSGGWGSSEGNGWSSLTVVPTPPATPTTLSSFTASPGSVANGGASTLSWSGTKGSSFSSCRLSGGQWGSGTWFTALPGSVSTQPLTTTTTYSMNCFDTTGTVTPTRSATVTVAAAPDACSNIAGNQATAPANGTAQGGVCSCNTGYTLQGAACVAVVDVCSNIAGNQATPPANGTTSGGTCSCNSGYTLQGASCVAVPVCSGAHQTGTPPNCSCEVGYQWETTTSSCVQVQCSGANEVNWPTCSCAAGYSRDSGTNTCIRQPVIDIKVNGQDAVRVQKGTQVVVTWSASGVAAGSCRITLNTGATFGSGDSGSVSTAVGHQTTYRLSCTNDVGTSVSREANATLIPDVIEQ